MEQSDRVVVLNLGTLLAEGLPSEVQRNQAVRDAYLGETELSRAEPSAIRARRTRRTSAMSEFWNLAFSGLGHRRDLRDHGVGPRADLHDVGHLQLRPRRGRVRHRVPLLPAEHRARCADRARAHHRGVHLRPAARTAPRPHPAPTAREGAGVRPHRRHHRSAGRAARADPVARRRASATTCSTSGSRATTRSTRALPVPGIGPTPHDTYKIGGVVLNSDQIAVFVVAALAAIVLWFVIRRTRVGLEMRAVVDRESLARTPRRERGPHVGGGVDPDDDPRRPRRRPHRAAVPAAGLRVHARRARLARRRRARRAAIDPDRVRRRSAPRRGPEPRRGLQRRHPAQVPRATSAASGRRCRSSSSSCCCSFIGRDRSRRAGSVADDVPPPDHRDGLSKLRRRLPWAIWTFILVAFSLRLVRLGLAAAPTPTTRP